MNAFTLDRFAHALEVTLESVPVTTRPLGLCVGLSGGLDSSVLLAALAELRQTPDSKRWAVRTVHVDHALHVDSARWGIASRTLAESLGVAYVQLRVDASPAPGESPEAAARAARYAAFREQLDPGEILLTAHHADDQLETVLLQWLRGGGLRAVAGMPQVAPLGTHAWHARPLLGFERAALEQFARNRDLRWVEDPSNADTRFDRNYLRHLVLPAVTSRWPGAARTVGRVAGYAREALELEAALARQDLARVTRGRALRVDSLHELPATRQRAVLRAWLAVLGLPTPGARTLAGLQRDVGHAAEDRNPATRWPGAIVHRYRGFLHAEAVAVDRFEEGAWAGHTEGRCYVGGATMSLELIPAIGVGLSRARLPSQLRVIRRRGGEEFKPLHGLHRRPLRKWLQEQGVLPWRRAGLPLLVEPDGRLVAIADLACAAHYAAHPGEPSWRLAWHGRGIVTESDAFGFKWPGRPAFG